MTIYDIATKLKVSPNTVSRAINNKPDVSAKTRSRILEFIEETGYTPNYLAKSLSSKKRFLLGLLYHPTLQPWCLQTINYTIDEARQKNYGVVCNTADHGFDHNPETFLSVIDNMCSYNLHALMLDAYLLGTSDSKLAPEGRKLKRRVKKALAPTA